MRRPRDILKSADVRRFSATTCDDLGGSDVPEIRDKLWRPDSSVSNSKIELCLSKTQRHSLRLKTLVGFNVVSWNSVLKPSQTVAVNRLMSKRPVLLNTSSEIQKNSAFARPWLTINSSGDVFVLDGEMLI